MRIFVLPIFDGVIMDGHPIFWVVNAGVAGIYLYFRNLDLYFTNILSTPASTTIKILDAHPLWHHRRWAKQKISSFFSFLVRIVLFLYLSAWTIVKNIITSFHFLHLNNYTTYENKCFNPRNQKSLRGVRHACKFRLRTDASRDTWCSRALGTQVPRVIAKRAIHYGPIMDGQSFWQNQWNFLLAC